MLSPVFLKETKKIKGNLNNITSASLLSQQLKSNHFFEM